MKDARADVARRVARWRRKRALEQLVERGGWLGPAAVVAVLLFAWRALAWGRAWALALSALFMASTIGVLLWRGGRS